MIDLNLDNNIINHVLSKNITLTAIMLHSQQLVLYLYYYESKEAVHSK